jgi:hypothetical protein
MLARLFGHALAAGFDGALKRRLAQDVPRIDNGFVGRQQFRRVFPVE